MPNDASLLVVQPGTRSSFRRRVIDAMRSLVSAPAGFMFFGTEDTRAYSDGSRLVDGVPKTLKNPGKISLSQAFGIEVKSVVEAPRRTYLAEELYPDDVRMKLPYFAEHSDADGVRRAMLVFLHEGGVLFGVAGLERRESEPAFTQAEADKIEELAPFVVAGARWQLAYDDLSREAAALRALTKTRGTLYVIDRDKKNVVWAVNRERGVDWQADVTDLEPQVVDAAEQLLLAQKKGDALPTPPRLPNGAVAGVAKVEGDPVFGVARCAVLRVEPPDDKVQPALEGLSRREREIARLLVAGYSGVNVAAISGLSENTVRTYVRRLYKKVGVNNRAELVRKLMAPEPNPTSSIAPPPDSSLVDGDETLD
jgi:DNA-binding CsgD family transcriptional regulator